MPVRQVPAVREIHAEHGVAQLQRRHVDGNVGLRARMRLHVGVLGAEQGLRAVDRQLLGAVHEFAAAVVALAGIALGVFVGEHRAHRFEHRFGNEIFRRESARGPCPGGVLLRAAPPRFPDRLPASGRFMCCEIFVSIYFGGSVPCGA